MTYNEVTYQEISVSSYTNGVAQCSAFINDLAQ